MRWHHENAEHLADYNLRWREANRDKQRAWDRRHRERKHPEDGRRRVLAQAKSNLARKSASIAYTVVESEMDEDVPVVEWLGKTNWTAEQLVRVDSATASKQQRKAIQLLRKLLTEPQPVKTVKEAGEAADLSLKTLEGARDRLVGHAYPVRDEHGAIEAWMWHLGDQEVEDCNQCD
jgi:hypothetical protein